MADALHVRFDYIGLHLKDFDGAVPFFADDLQLEVVNRGLERGGVLLDAVGSPEPLPLLRLRFPFTNTEVRLIGNAAAPLADADHKNTGGCHICFYTDDLDTTWPILERRGARLCSEEIVTIEGGVFDGGKCIYCVGPDGFRVEFLEGPAYLDGSRRDPDADLPEQRANEASHFGLHVTDRDRSLAFYRDALGIEEVAGWLEATPATRAVIGYPEAELYMSIMRLPGTQSYFEIIEYRGTDGIPIDNSLRSNGTCHLSFRVSSVDAVVAHLVNRGYAMLAREHDAIDGRPAAWFVDPDGYRVRFVEAQPE